MAADWIFKGTLADAQSSMRWLTDFALTHPNDVDPGYIFRFNVTSFRSSSPPRNQAVGHKSLLGSRLMPLAICVDAAAKANAARVLAQLTLLNDMVLDRAFFYFDF